MSNATFPRLLAALTLAGCSGAPPSGPLPSSAPTPAATSVAPTRTAEAAVTKQLDADAHLSSPSGASFDVAKGWFVTTRTGAIVVEAPERDLSIAFLESKEADATRAIELGWKQLSPGFARVVKQATKPPARDGWDEVTQIIYETTEAEGRIIVAIARRKGSTHYLALLDGTKAGLDRRRAQGMTAISSFKAPGVQEESFAGKTARDLDPSRLEAFAAFVEEARTQSKVPGVAIALVQNGRVVFEKGFGVREAGKKDSVTPNTLFMIGSITKSLTSMMMAKLVDEGKFTWDTPVTTLMPTFTLGDPEATKKLAIKHTVCACTGLPRQDMEFFFGFKKATSESRIADLRSMKPTTGFGETFQYSNSMVSAGGYIAAHAAAPGKALGAAYDEAMQSRVFGPIGMTSTTLSNAVAARRDHASPHAMTPKLEYVVAPTEDWIPSIRPAGGVWSSAHDMARYLLTELGKGKTPEGKAVATEANVLKRRERQVRIDDKSHYGLALVIEDDHGVPIVGHNGGTLGFNTTAFFLPDHAVGAVVLTNGSGAGALLGAVRRKLVEILFDGTDQAKGGLEFSLKRRADGNAKEFAKVQSSPDKAWLGRFVGVYESPALGQVSLRLEGGRAILDTGDWKSIVGDRKDDDGSHTFVPLDAPWVGFDFLAKEDSGHPTLVLDVGQQKYVFEPVRGDAPSARKP